MTDGRGVGRPGLEDRVEEIIAALPGTRDLSFLEVTLFCLVEHLGFREVLDTMPYTELAAFRANCARRASARATPFAFDWGRRPTPVPGYAPDMPTITVCIDVSDLARATAFYCDALGCTLRTTKDTHHTLDADGTTVHLSLKAEGTAATPGPATVRTYARHWTPVHVDFDVEDVDAVAAEVERFGGHV